MSGRFTFAVLLLIAGLAAGWGQEGPPATHPEIVAIVVKARDPKTAKTEALQLIDRAIGEAAATKDPIVEGFARDTKAFILYSRFEQTKEALEQYRLAADLFVKGGDRWRLSSAYYNSGVCLDDLGQHAEAIAVFERCAKLRAELGDAEGEANARWSIAQANLVMGKYDVAMTSLQVSRDLYAKAKDKSGEGRVLTLIGRLQGKTGKFQEGLATLDAALKIRREAGDLAGEAAVYNSIATIQVDIGKAEEALASYGQALAIARKLSDRWGEGAILDNMGLALARLGRFGESLKVLDEALTIVKEVGDATGEVAVLNNRANLLNRLGRPQDALRDLQQALEAAKKQGIKPSMATVLVNIGETQCDMGKFKEAVASYEAALQIAGEIGDTHAQCLAYDALGVTYQGLMEYDTAESYHRKALDIARALGIKRDEAICIQNIATCLLRAGKYAAAIPFFWEALLLERQVKDVAAEANTLYNLGWAFAHEGQFGSAALMLKESVRLSQLLRANIKRLSPETRKAFLATVEIRYRTLADLLIAMGRLAEAEEVLKMLKDEEQLSFERGVTRGEETGGGRLELVGREQGWWDEWLKLRDQAVEIQSKVSTMRAKPNRTPAEDQELESLRTQAETIRKATNELIDQIELAVKADRFREARAAEDRAAEVGVSGRLGSILKRLSTPDAPVVAVLAVQVKDSLHLIVVRPEGRIAKTIQIARSEMDRRIVEFRQALMNPDVDPRPAGKQIYDVLVNPIESSLAGCRVIWSLDGLLRYVPLAALWDGKQYLIERQSETMFSPLSVDALVDGDKQSAEIAFFASPKGDGDYPDLPGAQQEMESAKKYLPGVFLDGSLFTEKALQAELDAGKRTLLHFATHFRLGPTLDSSALLVGKRTTPQPSALASQRELTLEEMSSWSTNLFANIDLLVLSGCSTAKGGLNATSDGREVDSLASLAMRQGARCVVASLWDVADESTAALMGEMYRLWRKEGLSKGEALRRAQLGLLTGALKAGAAPATRSSSTTAPSASPGTRFTKDPKKPFAHPYYWAPFIMFGNWK